MRFPSVRALQDSGCSENENEKNETPCLQKMHGWKKKIRVEDDEVLWWLGFSLVDILVGNSLTDRFLFIVNIKG